MTDTKEREAFDAWFSRHSDRFDITPLEGRYMEEAWQARAAQPCSVPAGYALVPVEPTEEMHAAAVRTITRCHGNADFPPRVLAAMIAAAPTQPATGEGDAEDTARLDWILRHTPGDALRYSVGELADTADLSTFRSAIDAKRASKGEGNG